MKNNKWYLDITEQIGVLSKDLKKYKFPTTSTMISEIIQSVTQYSGQDSITGTESYTDANGVSHHIPTPKTTIIRGDSHFITREITPEYQASCDKMGFLCSVSVIERQLSAGIKNGYIDSAQAKKIASAIESIRGKIVHTFTEKITKKVA